MLLIVLHPSIIACMETIVPKGASKWSADSVTDASTLLLAITTTEFVSALVITGRCLQYLLGLTRSLQAEAKDIVQVVGEVNNVTATLKDLRKNVVRHHNEWFASVGQVCSNIGTVPSMPRICGRQRHRSNLPATNPSEYYRRTITVPILDHPLVDLVPSILVTIWECFIRF